MIIHKSFRYRVYPTPEQHARLKAWQDALRFLWNLAHEQRLMGLRRTDKRYPTAFDQVLELRHLRAELPWLADVPRDVGGQVLFNLDQAWRRYVRRVSRMPRWRCKRHGPMGLCMSSHQSWRLDGATLRFPKLGPMRAVVHRPLEGKRKTCTLVQDGDQWFCSIVCEIDVAPPPQPGVVAIDRGVTNVIADSDGRLVPGPIVSPLLGRRIRYAQRVVCRRSKGSKNREKAEHRVMRLCRKARRQREHFLHVESSRYAKSHGVIVLEDLKVRNMTASAKGTVEAPGVNVRQKAGLNRAILGAGWGRLGEMLTYKATWNGGAVVKVPAAYSSETCAVCGHVDAASRNGARFQCVCGHRDHADTNAAKVLLSRRADGEAVCRGSAAMGRPLKQKNLPRRARRVLLGYNSDRRTRP